MASALRGKNYLAIIVCYLISWTRIIAQVTIYRSLRIGRDRHLDQSEAYDIT